MYKIRVHDKSLNISIDRLKPAYTLEDTTSKAPTAIKSGRQSKPPVRFNNTLTCTSEHVYNQCGTYLTKLERIPRRLKVPTGRRVIATQQQRRRPVAVAATRQRKSSTVSQKSDSSLQSRPETEATRTTAKLLQLRASISVDNSFLVALRRLPIVQNEIIHHETEHRRQESYTTNLIGCTQYELMYIKVVHKITNSQIPQVAQIIMPSGQIQQVQIVSLPQLQNLQINIRCNSQKIDVQTLSSLTRPPETVEGDIKVTNIDASQLTSGQVIRIPATRSAQPTVQPITITGTQGQQLAYSCVRISKFDHATR
ncbi:hypothetical protein G5I_03700 [Acromyrmex echinatior]|uniref:Uncharacterized protein n=1 Tax=Acromyrmex echinatior TaxID=103372 RepID=F4WDP4_ACREC|nr:hypothetical protein G5I_03700 [Acromyrmex echinatior]